MEGLHRQKRTARFFQPIRGPQISISTLPALYLNRRCHCSACRLNFMCTPLFWLLQRTTGATCFIVSVSVIAKNPLQRRVRWWPVVSNNVWKNLWPPGHVSQSEISPFGALNCSIQWGHANQNGVSSSFDFSPPFSFPSCGDAVVA